MSIDDEWLNFINNNETQASDLGYNENNNENNIIPESTSLNISTKTKIIYLNKIIKLEDIFWKIN